MKLHLEATHEELRSKGTLLVESIAKALRHDAPELAEALFKAAMPQHEPELKHQALRDIKDKISKRYQITLDMMLAEIGRKLDDHVSGMKKAASPSEVTSISIMQRNYVSEVFDLEAKAYEQAKAALHHYGYSTNDYEMGGKLYGMSVNELRELSKRLKEQEKVG